MSLASELLVIVKEVGQPNRPVEDVTVLDNAAVLFDGAKKLAERDYGAALYWTRNEDESQWLGFGLKDHHTYWYRVFPVWVHHEQVSSFIEAMP